jgi:methyl-accepting chemotaxis protein
MSTEPTRRARFGLRAQIMVTILLVGAAEAGIGIWRVYQTHREVSRSTILNSHRQRFESIREQLGESMAANAALAVRGFDLGGALGRGEGPSVAERVAAALAETSAPDLVLVLDREGRLVRAPGVSSLSAAELARARLVRDALSGLVLTDSLALLDGRLYQVASAPARDATGEVVGALVLGRRFDAMAARFTRDSHREAARRVHPTAVAGDASFTTLDVDDPSALFDATATDRWIQIEDGPDMVDAIDFGGKAWNFARQEELMAYAGAELRDVGDLFYLREQREERGAAEKLESSLWTLGSVAAITLAVGWFLAWLITRRINRYVRATEDLARGEGDLTKRLEVGRPDELGRLATNLNAVFGHIHDLAAKVQRAAFQVGASSAEIGAASRQMLEGAQEQARRTESSTAAVTELSASIQQVAENATEATRVARKSGASVQDAISRMQGIRSTVDEAAARIHELGESGKRIGNIVEVIRQISDQTTLLALNAAIEAAHAGEHGKGFAVVADEVSGLAKRVGQSARDIEELIATIREQTVDAVRAMEAGTREVEEGTKLVTFTLADLQSLMQVVEDTAQAVQEQAVASDEIARNMDTVQRIASDVLSSSEEAVEQGDHLHRLAHGLEESVKGFKIDPSRVPDDPAPALPTSTKALASGEKPRR